MLRGMELWGSRVVFPEASQSPRQPLQVTEHPTLAGTILGSELKFSSPE